MYVVRILVLLTRPRIGFSEPTNIRQQGIVGKRPWGTISDTKLLPQLVTLLGPETGTHSKNDFSPAPIPSVSR
jgi:hypothetical protein